MNIVLYGPTGKSGSRILTELTTRGHHVTAIARNPSKVAATPNTTVLEGDVSNVDAIAKAITGADAVISAYGPPPDDTKQLIGATDNIVKAVERVSAANPQHAPRLVVVGGAGSLFVAPGVTLHASGHLPAEWIPISDAHIAVLEALEKSSIDWTYFSPAAYFEPGKRTGKFRLGKDDLIADEKHESRISMEDYAIALVDELEQPKHRRERFAIGY
ncbi:MAG: NAD(P)-dependent oxidoreductase [Bryocella sp.]